MLTATIALVVMVAIAITSVYSIRRRFRRETWWAVHLFMYLALAPRVRSRDRARTIVCGAPAHEVRLVRALGLDRGPRARLPIRAARCSGRLRHRLEVVEIHPEGPDTVSVVCRGRNLDRLAVAGGQFFEWRFLAKGMWWQAHPFSLSARPRPPFLRITVKGIGDYSSAVARLRPGTRVAIEGPYGAFTTHARRRSEGCAHRRRHRCDGHPFVARGPSSRLRPGRDPSCVDHRGAGPGIGGSRARPAPQRPGSRARRLSPEVRDRPSFRARAGSGGPGRLRVGTRGIRRSGRDNRPAARGPQGLAFISRSTPCDRCTTDPQEAETRQRPRSRTR